MCLHSCPQHGADAIAGTVTTGGGAAVGYSTFDSLFFAFDLKLYLLSSALSLCVVGDDVSYSRTESSVSPLSRIRKHYDRLAIDYLLLSSRQCR